MTPEDKARCMTVLSDTFHGEHHIPGDVVDGGFYLEVPMQCGSLATYDFDELTRLVLSAHRNAVRAQIGARGMNRMVIMLHPRQRDGTMSQRHPTIEQAIERLEPKKEVPS